MWRLKGCPRCKGDMLIDREYCTWYEWCLQCGHRRDLKGIFEAREVAPTDKAAPEKV